MFDEWRKRRELRKKIAQLTELEALSRARTDKKSAEYDPEAKREFHGYEIGCLHYQLADLETDQLVRRARWWGIQIPQNQSWWMEDEGFEGELINGVRQGKFYLTEFGKAGVSKLIQDERRKSIEWWVTVVIVPILSTVIGVLGLLVAYVAVSK